MTCDWGNIAMGWWAKLRGQHRGGGFLTHLARHRGGNTLAIMAAALIPLAGLVGSGIDMSRMYITKTRLQHACDAGALAGRKSMGAGSWGTDDNAVAQKFFDANYSATLYGGTLISRAFAESGGTVTGNASVSLPMTITRVIGQTTQTLAVTCSTAMQLPNTDVMFVLDTTGSMNCVASDTSCSNNGNVAAPGSKIIGLKNAVKCFYESVAQQKTNGTCTKTLNGSLNPSIQVRFGFVPYSSNVNVGYLLPAPYFADTWKYQSREPQWTITSTDSWNQTGQTSSSSNASQNGVAKNDCTQANANAIYGSHSDTTSGNIRTVKDTTVQNVTWNNYVCSGTIVTTTTTYTKSTTTTKTFNQWHYGQIATDVSALKSGTGQPRNLTLPIGPQGANQTVTWDGCIEERHTVQTTNYSPIPSGANDLDIDAVPTAGDANSLWGPALPPAIYLRNVTTSWSQATTADSYTTNDDYQGYNYTCPTSSQKLKVWGSVTDFDTYVDSLVASGNTYHDIGMLWGARLMSPTGIFASENALAGNGGTINRNMIFMTDGDSTSQPCDYNAYGIPWWDQRQTTDVGPSNQCSGYNRQALIDQINLRYAALCTAVKNKGINLYVISYGNGSSATTEQRLSDCASAGAYYKATDPTALQTAFTAIAAKINLLRLTR